MVVGYGKSIREKVRNAVLKSKTRYQCPKCSRMAVKRASSAIWQCIKCNAKFASGTYEFK
ncbi:MAG: 50S ribosomal protein L37ae [Candidatus Aenigmarchaeota archaeon]|nr:50S ribosomal protein L37ae [Candidatus Aenigmarchaeota archaeon]